MDSSLRITAVDPDPRRPDAVRVEIDGARFGAVPRELASVEGLAVGRVVDPALQELLASAADAEAAYRTVLRALEVRSAWRPASGAPAPAPTACSSRARSTSPA